MKDNFESFRKEIEKKEKEIERLRNELLKLRKKNKSLEEELHRVLMKDPELIKV